jgi:hypothetical protein
MLPLVVEMCAHACPTVGTWAAKPVQVQAGNFATPQKRKVSKIAHNWDKKQQFRPYGLQSRS